MKKPSRLPVRAEQYLLNSIAICWPYLKSQDLRFQLNVVAEQLQQELDKKNGRRKSKKQKTVVVENTEGEDIKKFIILFRNRYAQETDMEYRTQIQPEEIGVIKSIVKKLRDKGVEIDDYLSWVFEVFFDDQNNREKFSPVIKFICGTFMASKFFMSNRDKLRKKKEEAGEKSYRKSVRDYGIKLFRKTKNSEVQRMLQKEYEGTITMDYLEEWLKKKEKELEEVNSDG